MSTQLEAEGKGAQFVVVSDAQASWYASAVAFPIFRDPSAGLAAWNAFEPGAPKHLTFVYDAQGRKRYRWYSSAPSTFAAEVGAAVRALY